MKKQDIPNLITIIRLLSIIPLCAAFFAKQYQIAFYIFILAGISDGLDGYLARRFGWQSKLGAIVDPLADKLLMLTTYACLTWLQVVPVWLFMLVIGRDMIIIVGALLYHYLIEEPSYKARLFSKINTVMQIILVLLLLIHIGFMPLTKTLVSLAIFLVTLTTVISLIDYVVIWSNRAFKIWKAKQI